MSDNNKKDTPKSRKFVCYAFVVEVFTLITSIIAWLTNKFMVYFTYKDWGLTDWFLFLSVLGFIGVLCLYSSPFFATWLKQRLDDKIEGLVNKSVKDQKADKQAKKEAKQDRLQSKRSEVKQYD